MDIDTATPRRRLSPEHRREEILVAARAVFSESGLVGTRMRDVAERAGITETHLYRYFRKDELFQDAIVSHLDELGERVARETRELAERPDISRAQLLEHFHELCLGYFIEAAPLLRAGTLDRGPEGSWPPRSLFPKWWDLVSEVIADISGWERESFNLDVLVQAWMGLYLMIGLESVLDAKPVDVTRTAAELTTMFAPSRLDARDRGALRRAAKRAETRAAPPPEDLEAQEPGRRLSRPERRASILEAAGDLFSEVGLSAARSRDIADRAQITETFLYRHFASKDEMYEASIEEPCETALRELAENVRALAAERAGVAFVVEFNRVAVRFLSEHGSLLATAMLADLDRSRRFFRDRARPHLDALAEVIAERMGYAAEGVDPRLARQAIFGSQWGVTMDLDHDEHPGVDDVSLHLARLFTLGVVPT